MSADDSNTPFLDGIVDEILRGERVVLFPPGTAAFVMANMTFLFGSGLLCASALSAPLSGRRLELGIFLVSHDIHDVFDLADRISVMYHGRLVGTVNKTEVTTDEILGMIILGKPPEKLSREEVEALR